MKKLQIESKIEAHLVKSATERGGMAIKLLSQFHRGLPDRLVLLPGGRMAFVELKTTGRRPTLLQARTHGKLRDLGFAVYVADSTEQVDDILGQTAGTPAQTEEGRR